MSVINFQRKEIVAKVVYYGPALSGKTTNVQFIHSSIPGNRRGRLTSLATQEDRTLFFDYVPIHLGNIGGFKTKFQVFTVPGQVYYSSTRRVVLQATDGVVFVADSTPGSMDANLESLADLRKNLLHYDKFLNAIPFVIQYNKRDLPDAIPLQEMERELNLIGVRSFPASALNGDGVLDTLSRVSSLVLTHLKASIEGKLSYGRRDPSVIQQFGNETVDDETLVRDLMAQIKKLRPGEVDAEIQIVEDDEEEGEAEMHAGSSFEDIATSVMMLPQRPGRREIHHLNDEAETTTLSVSDQGLVEPLEDPSGDVQVSHPQLVTGHEQSLSEHGEAGIEAPAESTIRREGSPGPDEEIESTVAGGPLARSSDFESSPAPPPPPVAQATWGAPDEAHNGAGAVVDGAGQRETTIQTEGSRQQPARSDHEPQECDWGEGAGGGEKGAPPEHEIEMSIPETGGSGVHHAEVHSRSPERSMPDVPIAVQAQLEVAGVETPTVEEGVCCVPILVRDPRGGDPRRVTLRFRLDDAAPPPDGPSGLPNYIYAWLAGLTILTLLAIGLVLF